MKVEIYGAEWCAWCKQAKIMCEASEIDTVWYDVDNEGVKEELEEKLQMPPRGIPQIFVDKVHVGGYTQLRDKLMEG